MHRSAHTLLTALISLTLAAAGFTHTAAAAEGTDQWFGAVKLSIGDVTLDSVSATGIGTGAIINGQVDGRLEDTETDDYTAGIGFAAGRRIGNWHLELEYTWRYRTDWDVVASTDSIQTITNVFSNVETSGLLFNLARRGIINQDWSWEIGAGIGLVYNTVEATYIEREVPGVRDEMRFKDERSKTDFSYAVFAGLTRDLRGPWTMNLRYRHIDLGELEAGPFPGRPARLSADHTSGELQLSFERNL